MPDLVAFGGEIWVWTPAPVWLLGGILANVAGVFTGVALMRRLGFA
jgi:hypothetical protein